MNYLSKENSDFLSDKSDNEGKLDIRNKKISEY